MDPKAKKAQKKSYQNMTFSQKMNEVSKMRALAWDMKAAYLRSKKPEWSEERVQQEVKRIFLYAST